MMVTVLTMQTPLQKPLSEQMSALVEFASVELVVNSRSQMLSETKRPVWRFRCCRATECEGRLLSPKQERVCPSEVAEARNWASDEPSQVNSTSMSTMGALVAPTLMSGVQMTRELPSTVQDGSTPTRFTISRSEICPLFSHRISSSGSKARQTPPLKWDQDKL